MNIEEAGEIVLEGGAWMQCAACKGNGQRVQKGEEKETHVECSRCKGAGSFLPSYVVQAYQRLEIELPPKPLTPHERIAMVTANFVKDRVKTGTRFRRIKRP